LKSVCVANLQEYIKFYPKVMDEDLCEFLILSFQMSKDKTEYVRNDVIDFTQLNINRHCTQLVSNVIEATRFALKLYKASVPDSEYFPKNTLALEEFRLKCYNGGTGQQFRKHVDIGDYNSARRFLAFLYYLNDDFTGGETEFFNEMKITPKRGSVLVFPPTWQYPHAGLPVDTGNKYILSTYLHYT